MESFKYYFVTLQINCFYLKTMLTIFSAILQTKMFWVNWMLKWFDWRWRGLINYDVIFVIPNTRYLVNSMINNIRSSNKITKLVLDQRTTPHIPNICRGRHRQTSNRRNNLLHYPFTSNKTNRISVKANVTAILDLRSFNSLILLGAWSGNKNIVTKNGKTSFSYKTWPSLPLLK